MVYVNTFITDLIVDRFFLYLEKRRLPKLTSTLLVGIGQRGKIYPKIIFSSQQAMKTALHPQDLRI